MLEHCLVAGDDGVEDARDHRAESPEMALAGQPVHRQCGQREPKEEVDRADGKGLSENTPITLMVKSWCSWSAWGNQLGSWKKGAPRSSLMPYQPWSSMSLNEASNQRLSPDRLTGSPGRHCQTFRACPIAATASSIVIAGRDAWLTQARICPMVPEFFVSWRNAFPDDRCRRRPVAATCRITVPARNRRVRGIPSIRDRATPAPCDGVGAFASR